MMAKVRSSDTKDSSKLFNQRYRAEAGNYKIGKNLGPEGLSYSLFQGGGESAAEVRGSFDRAIPAAAIAAYLSLAVPCPPLMMAPAWPIRRPGGRGLSGNEADDGLLHIGLNPFGGALFPALPPISPIKMMAWCPDHR